MIKVWRDMLAIIIIHIMFFTAVMWRAWGIIQLLEKINKVDTEAIN